MSARWTITCPMVALPRCETHGPRRSGGRSDSRAGGQNQPTGTAGSRCHGNVAAPLGRRLHALGSGQSNAPRLSAGVDRSRLGAMAGGEVIVALTIAGRAAADPDGPALHD